MVETLAPKWTPHGLMQRYRRIVCEPGDLRLCWQIAVFVARAPRLIETQDLRSFIDGLRSDPAPRGRYAQVARLRSFVLSKPWFARANTCYVRALTLYRFLDERDGDIGLHFGIERRACVSDRLHGHAWITLKGKMLEGPPEAVEGRIREIRLLPSPQ